jgi:hypothetical protein
MKTTNEVRIHKVKSWQEFIGIINQLDYDATLDATTEPYAVRVGFSSGCIFRGQSNSHWKLSSKIERQMMMGENGNAKQRYDSDWFNGVCKEILEKFKDNISTIPSYSKLDNENEIWALGRHHGLFTPLLDWSYNPYIAAFFAFYDVYKELEFKYVGGRNTYDGEHAVVWKLNVWEDTFKTDEFDTIKVHSKIGTRVNAQEGLFTYLKTNLYFDVESYLKSRGLAHFLEKIELPYSIASEALVNLDRMGINIFKLFPDFAGAAEQANIQTEELNKVNAFKIFETLNFRE